MRNVIFFVLILVFVEKSTCLQCETCTGFECFRSRIPKQRCGRNFPQLPFELNIYPSQANGRYEYGCLDLQYYKGKITYTIKQCLPVTQQECLCEKLKFAMRIKKCSFYGRNSRNQRRHDNEKQTQFCETVERPDDNDYNEYFNDDEEDGNNENDEDEKDEDEEDENEEDEDENDETDEAENDEDETDKGNNIYFDDKGADQAMYPSKIETGKNNPKQNNLGISDKVSTASLHSTSAYSTYQTTTRKSKATTSRTAAAEPTRSDKITFSTSTGSTKATTPTSVSTSNSVLTSKANNKITTTKKQSKHANTVSSTAAFVQPSTTISSDGKLVTSNTKYILSKISLSSTKSTTIHSTNLFSVINKQSSSTHASSTRLAPSTTQWHPNIVTSVKTITQFSSKTDIPVLSSSSTSADHVNKYLPEVTLKPTTHLNTHIFKSTSSAIVSKTPVTQTSKMTEASSSGTVKSATSKTHLDNFTSTSFNHDILSIQPIKVTHGKSTVKTTKRPALENTRPTNNTEIPANLSTMPNAEYLNSPGNQFSNSVDSTMKTTERSFTNNSINLTSNNVSPQLVTSTATAIPPIFMSEIISSSPPVEFYNKTKKSTVGNPKPTASTLPKTSLQNIVSTSLKDEKLIITETNYLSKETSKDSASGTEKSTTTGPVGTAGYLPKASSQNTFNTTRIDGKFTNKTEGITSPLPEEAYRDEVNGTTKTKIQFLSTATFLPKISLQGSSHTNINDEKSTKNVMESAPHEAAPKYTLNGNENTTIITPLSTTSFLHEKSSQKSPSVGNEKFNINVTESITSAPPAPNEIERSTIITSLSPPISWHKTSSQQPSNTNIHDEKSTTSETESIILYLPEKDFKGSVNTASQGSSNNNMNDEKLIISGTQSSTSSLPQEASKDSNNRTENSTISSTLSTVGILPETSSQNSSNTNIDNEKSATNKTDGFTSVLPKETNNESINGTKPFNIMSHQSTVSYLPETNSPESSKTNVEVEKSARNITDSFTTSLLEETFRDSVNGTENSDFVSSLSTATFSPVTSSQEPSNTNMDNGKATTNKTEIITGFVLKEASEGSINETKYSTIIDILSAVSFPPETSSQESPNTNMDNGKLTTNVTESITSALQEAGPNDTLNENEKSIIITPLSTTSILPETSSQKSPSFGNENFTINVTESITSAPSEDASKNNINGIEMSTIITSLSMPDNLSKTSSQQPSNTNMHYGKSATSETESINLCLTENNFKGSANAASQGSSNNNMNDEKIIISGTESSTSSLPKEASKDSTTENSTISTPLSAAGFLPETSSQKSSNTNIEDKKSTENKTDGFTSVLPKETYNNNINGTENLNIISHQSTVSYLPKTNSPESTKTNVEDEKSSTNVTFTSSLLDETSRNGINRTANSAIISSLSTATFLPVTSSQEPLDTNMDNKKATTNETESITGFILKEASEDSIIDTKYSIIIDILSTASFMPQTSPQEPSNTNIDTTKLSTNEAESFTSSLLPERTFKDSINKTEKYIITSSLSTVSFPAEISSQEPLNTNMDGTLITNETESTISIPENTSDESINGTRNSFILNILSTASFIPQTSAQEQSYTNIDDKKSILNGTESFTNSLYEEAFQDNINETKNSNILSLLSTASFLPETSSQEPSNTNINDEKSTTNVIESITSALQEAASKDNLTGNENSSIITPSSTTSFLPEISTQKSPSIDNEKFTINVIESIFSAPPKDASKNNINGIEMSTIITSLSTPGNLPKTSSQQSSNINMQYGKSATSETESITLYLAENDFKGNVNAASQGSSNNNINDEKIMISGTESSTYHYFLESSLPKEASKDSNHRTESSTIATPLSTVGFLPETSSQKSSNTNTDDEKSAANTNYGFTSVLPKEAYNDSFNESKNMNIISHQSTISYLPETNSPESSKKNVQDEKSSRNVTESFTSSLLVNGTEYSTFISSLSPTSFLPSILKEASEESINETKYSTIIGILSTASFVPLTSPQEPSNTNMNNEKLTTNETKSTILIPEKTPEESINGTRNSFITSIPSTASFIPQTSYQAQSNTNIDMYQTSAQELSNIDIDNEKLTTNGTESFTTLPGEPFKDSVNETKNTTVISPPSAGSFLFEISSLEPSITNIDNKKLTTDKSKSITISMPEEASEDRIIETENLTFISILGTASLIPEINSQKKSNANMDDTNFASEKTESLTSFLTDEVNTASFLPETSSQGSTNMYIDEVNRYETEFITSSVTESASEDSINGTENLTIISILNTASFITQTSFQELSNNNMDDEKSTTNETKSFNSSLPEEYFKDRITKAENSTIISPLSTYSFLPQTNSQELLNSTMKDRTSTKNETEPMTSALPNDVLKDNTNATENFISRLSTSSFWSKTDGLIDSANGANNSYFVSTLSTASVQAETSFQVPLNTIIMDENLTKGEIKSTTSALPDENIFSKSANSTETPTTNSIHYTSSQKTSYNPGISKPMTDVFPNASPTSEEQKTSAKTTNKSHLTTSYLQFAVTSQWKSNLTESFKQTTPKSTTISLNFSDPQKTPNTTQILTPITEVVQNASSFSQEQKTTNFIIPPFITSETTSNIHSEVTSRKTPNLTEGFRTTTTTESATSSLYNASSQNIPNITVISSSTTEGFYNAFSTSKENSTDIFTHNLTTQVTLSASSIVANTSTIATNIHNSSSTTTRADVDTSPKTTTARLTNLSPTTSSNSTPKANFQDTTTTAVSKDVPAKHKIEDDYDYDLLNATSRPQAPGYIFIAIIIILCCINM